VESTAVQPTEGIESPAASEPLPAAVAEPAIPEPISVTPAAPDLISVTPAAAELISVTPVTQVIAIHDAALPAPLSEPVEPRNGQPVFDWNAADAVNLTRVTTSEFQVPAAQPFTHYLEVSQPALTLVEPARQPTSSVPLPRAPLGATASAAPPALPSTLLTTGGGSPGAAPPILTVFGMAAGWRGLWLLTQLQPVAIALKSLAPPG
jgi:hypothetical protein